MATSELVPTSVSEQVPLVTTKGDQPFTVDTSVRPENVTGADWLRQMRNAPWRDVPEMSYAIDEKSVMFEVAPS